MNKLERAANEYRSELLKQNDAALEELIQAYTRSWVKIKTKLDLVMLKINANAAIANKDWLLREQRYKELMNSLQSELKLLTDITRQITDEQTRLAINYGQNDALKMMDISVNNKALSKLGLSVEFNTLNDEAIVRMLGILSKNSPIDKLLNRYPEEGKKSIQDNLITGITEGLNPRVITRNIRNEYSGNLSNLSRVIRTETFRAYRSSQTEIYKENSDVVIGWIWCSALGLRSCSSCWSMHGTEHSLEEDLNDHPSGRCTRLPLTKTWQALFPELDLKDLKNPEIATGSELFQELSPAQQKEILGPTRYEAFLGGKLNIQDLAGMIHNEDYGSTVKIKNLTELGLK